MAKQRTPREKWEDRGIRGTDYTSQHDRRRKQAADVMERVVEHRRTARALEGSQGRAAKRYAEEKLARKSSPDVYELYPNLEKEHKRERNLINRFIAQRARGVGK